MGKEMNLIREDEYGGGGVGFEPTEDELMLHFLRPQLRGFAPRVAGAVVEADPCGAAPWELLARHGRREEGINYCFYVRGEMGQQRSTGWMMAEYEITDPRCYRRADDGEEDDFWVLCHVRKSSRPSAAKISPAKPARRRKPTAAADVRAA
uniref:NAC domain-containing protein n=1 Tax=Oryza glumipatula TaxID=40148 RepID=A0A0D9YJY5_9ORYZ